MNALDFEPESHATRPTTATPGDACFGLKSLHVGTQDPDLQMQR